MSKPINITINMEPIPKGRPRTTVSNGNIRTYTPDRTRIAEEELKARFLWYKDQILAFDVPVKLTVTFFLHKSPWLKNPRKYAKLPAWGSDIDNLTKTILDSGNEILFTDDKQVTTLTARKRWSDNGHGYIVIKLEEDKE